MHSSTQNKLRHALRPLCLCGEKNSNFNSFSPSQGLSTSRGFTLIEIVVVLIIIGLIAAGSIATVVLTSSERTLRNQSSEIEMLAKKARTTAILRQKPYAIVFRMNSIELLPLTQSNEYERTTALGNQIGGSSSDDETRTNLYQSIKIDSSIRLTIRHWNTASFIAPTENEFPVWRFDPDGLCEPITVRLSINNSYAQDTYHPLTASIADSELEAN